MEAPKKIYLYPSDRAGEEYEAEWGGMPWGEDYVEYTRTDVFIKKACEVFCKFCGHSAIKTQGYTCRQDCGYYRKFKEAIMEE